MHMCAFLLPSQYLFKRRPTASTQIWHITINKSMSIINVVKDDGNAQHGLRWCSDLRVSFETTDEYVAIIKKRSALDAGNENAIRSSSRSIHWLVWQQLTTRPPQMQLQRWRCDPLCMHGLQNCFSQALRSSVHHANLKSHLLAGLATSSYMALSPTWCTSPKNTHAIDVWPNLAPSGHSRHRRKIVITASGSENNSKQIRQKLFLLSRHMCIHLGSLRTQGVFSVK